ncbi:MAG: hypothetical protein WKF57_06755 [Nakamurella sp.]
MSRQRREPSGTSSGGRFAFQQHSEANISLPGDPGIGAGVDPDPATDASIDPATTREDQELTAAMTVDSDDLWNFVRHEDPGVRGASASNPHLTVAQARELLSEDQPTPIRVEVASRARGPLVEVTAADRDPFVRVWAVDLRESLSSVARYALDRDRAVQRLHHLVSGGLQPELLRVS